MLNRFKLWLNRNDSKIIITILLILVTYFTIEKADDYYENQNYENTLNSQVNENATQNTDNNIY